MGYLKVTPSDSRMPARVTALPRAGDFTLRARRAASTPANGKAHLPRADQLALANIAQRFAPGAAPVAPGTSATTTGGEDQRRVQAPKMQRPRITAAPTVTSVATSVRGMRTLIAALIGVALLPSALFGILLWSGAIQLNSSAPSFKSPGATWQAAAPASVTGALGAEEPQPSPVKTLTPPTPAQEKAADAGSESTAPVQEAAGEPEPTQMASAEPAAKTEQEPEVTASIAPVEEVAQGAELPYDTNLIGVVSWDNKKQALLGASGVEELLTGPDDTVQPPEDLLRLPEADDDKNWITAPQWVNLRKGPTSSAAVISVVAKGTKLEVKGRKRGWVQVTNPETSESGWIYAGSKARRNRGSDSEADADGGSWLSLRSLLGR